MYSLSPTLYSLSPTLYSLSPKMYSLSPTLYIFSPTLGGKHCLDCVLLLLTEHRLIWPRLFIFQLFYIHHLKVD